MTSVKWRRCAHAKACALAPLPHHLSLAGVQLGAIWAPTQRGDLRVWTLHKQFIEQSHDGSYPWVHYRIHRRVCAFETLPPIAGLLLDQHTTTLLKVYGNRAGPQGLPGLCLPTSLAESLVWGGEAFFFRMFEAHKSDRSPAQLTSLTHLLITSRPPLDRGMHPLVHAHTTRHTMCFCYGCVAGDLCT